MDPLPKQGEASGGTPSLSVTPWCLSFSASLVSSRCIVLKYAWSFLTPSLCLLISVTLTVLLQICHLQFCSGADNHSSWVPRGSAPAVPRSRCRLRRLASSCTSGARVWSELICRRPGGLSLERTFLGVYQEPGGATSLGSSQPPPQGPGPRGGLRLSAPTTLPTEELGTHGRLSPAFPLGPAVPSHVCSLLLF